MFLFKLLAGVSLIDGIIDSVKEAEAMWLDDTYIILGTPDEYDDIVEALKRNHITILRKEKDCDGEARVLISHRDVERAKKVI